MAREDDIKLKDMLRAIEAGEIEEDLDLPDPEEYDDMGGIKSLDKGAPSIKLAYETGPEEFELELMSVIREFNDLKEKGLIGPDVTVDEYINDYLSKKKMKMKQDRQMAMYGGRMQYKDAGSVMDVVDKKGEEEYYNLKAEQLDRKYNAKNYPPSQRNMSIEQIKKMLKKAEEDKLKRANGGRIGFNEGSGATVGKTVFGDISEIDVGESIKESGKSLINMFSPSEIMRVLSEAGEGFKQLYFNLKSDSEKENLLKKIMGDSYGDTEKLKKMLKKAEEDKLKRAKGGIAGVL
jgi:hypothetical protein